MIYRIGSSILSMSTIATVFLSVGVPVASAADWALGQGEGKCYKNGSFAGNYKYCNNCKQHDGNQLKWTFQVTCNGKEAGKIEATYTCGSSIPEEGDQLRALQAAAKPNVPPSTKNCP